MEDIEEQQARELARSTYEEALRKYTAAAAIAEALSEEVEAAWAQYDFYIV